MKLRVIFLGIGVWAVSLVGAYLIGSANRGSALPSDPRSNETSPSASGETAEASDLPPLQVGAESDAPEAIQLSDLMRNGAPGELDREVALAALDQDGARALLAEAFALPVSNPQRADLIEDLILQIAAQDPRGALELTGQIASLRDRRRARNDVLELWGRNDPASALAWAAQALGNETIDSRRSQIASIYEGYAEANPQAAFQEALSLEGDLRLRERILNEVIEVQVEAGQINQARLAIDLIDDPALQAELRSELVDEWAEFDPAAAAQYVDSLGDAADPALKARLVSEWAESDPAAAAAWLSQLSVDDPAFSRASSSIIREWARYDLAASAEWLNALPASPELDRAVMSYAYRAAEEDPASAMTWAESIENDRQRGWIMERVAARWREQDAEGFTVYLDQGGFEPEVRERLENADGSHYGRGRGWR
jgi:hypothetical protein